MELSLENTLERLRLYTGEEADGGDRDALMEALCQECLDGVRERLRPDLDEEAAPGAESLAAAEAFVQLALLDRAGQPDSVSTPELKIQQGDRVEYAQALLAEKRRAAGGILQEAFYFGGA